MKKNDFSKIYLENILKRIPGSVYWKDLNGAYLGCNQMQADMAGLSTPEEMIGKTDAELPWKNIADTLKTIDQRIMNTGVFEEIIETPTLSNGTKLVMLTHKFPLLDDDGSIIGIIGTSLDITSLKAAEEREREALKEATITEEKRRAEEETSKAVTILAGSIVHDLRSPLLTLRLINGSLEACLQRQRKTPLDEHDQESLLAVPHKIERVIQQMHAFIDTNLKSLKASNASSIQEDDLVVCKSHKTLNDALSAYPFKTNERDLIRMEATHTFEFMGNPILFLRIIFNLINNALYQIHKNNEGEILIRTEALDDANIIRFKDTAGGVGTDAFHKLFQGYHTTKDHGTGVGLAFCKMTMESFGGVIDCVNNPGQSIEFILVFPKLI